MERFFIEDDLKPLFSTSAEVTYPASGIRYPVSAVRLPADLPLSNKFNLITKRSFDIIFSLILIPLLLLWLIPLFAILIKLDSRGPVFFLQKRNRNGGKIFSCIKFRTMIVNEDADQLVASPDDKRVTGFGRFLRHHHLDELPQLFNVLMGDMSLIGPRPYMIKENLYYESLLERYNYRHSIKPGMTGLAQSFGYFGSHDMEKVKERFLLDMQYIHKWSLGMDISILFRTFMMLVGIKS